jgi:hypothetical protein
MPSQKTVGQALDALDGMATIVKREMTGRVGYVSQYTYDKRLAESGAICGGRKYCAVGSLWVGAGIKPEGHDGTVNLPGTDEDERDAFLRGRHGLRLAYNALNEAADAYVKRTGARKTALFEAPIEALFEGQANGLNRTELLKVVNDAKRRVRKVAS